jgi:hypothetical protein
LPVVSASITSVTTPILPGTYGEDSQIPIVIDYNTNVNVVGSPVLETSNGDAQYASNSGGKVTFLYTVAASDSGYVDVISFDTSNGNISDDSSEFPEYELGIVLDGDVDSRSTITINTPSVVDKSSVWTNVSFSGPNSAKTVTTLTANSTQTNVCVNCAITLTDGTYTLSVTTTNVVNLTNNSK